MNGTHMSLLTIEDKLAYARKIYKSGCKIRAVKSSDGLWSDVIRRSVRQPELYVHEELEGTFVWIISNCNLYNPITDTWALVYNQEYDVWVNPGEMGLIPKMVKKFVFAE